MKRLLLTAMLCCCAGPVAAQSFRLSSADVADSAALSSSMPRLAAEVLAVYRDSNRARFLDHRFRLELLTGKYADAVTTMGELRPARSDTSPAGRARDVALEIYARARTRNGPFAEAFAAAFREVFAGLDNAAAAFAIRSLLVTARTVASDLRWATPSPVKDSVPLQDALTLLHVYSAVEAYRAFAGMPAALVAEDDARRYLVETDIPVKTPDGATTCAVVARPRSASGRLPAILHFTIYADSVGSVRDAILSAAHGYAGVMGHSRGKACSTGPIEPYRHDGSDAAALIDWIAAQPWSDGRVGMFGGSYSGFTAWAAAKHMPKALKTIMVGAPVAPGIDVPMEGNVFVSFVYQWPFYAASNRWLDQAANNDFPRWNRLTRQWYTSGRPYRDLDEIDGTPNPIFMDWVAHPTLDPYWRSVVPEGREFAGITIPVLQTSGYFFGGPGGALPYFLAHYLHNPRANHYLLIGPYDHFQAQRGVVTAMGDTATFIAGYEIDPVAGVDISAEVKYQWFDHVLRGGPLPRLIKDRVNYQVMGANTWKHAPGLAAMASERLRLYFRPSGAGRRHILSRAAAKDSGAIVHTVNLADRSDIDVQKPFGLRSMAIDTSNAVVLVSDPLPGAVELSGMLSGRLELVANKRDFDFALTLYELRPDGQYFQLPPYTSRASHVESPGRRRLLVPGQPVRLDFESQLRMMSRQLAAGSRLVLVIAVIKNPGQQINYGTGKDVSDESIADAGAPLVIRWGQGSFVEIPIRRAP